MPHNDEDCRFDYFRFYHTDYLPGPEWDIHTLYKAEPMGRFFDVRANTYNDKMLSNNGIEDYKKLGACFPKTDKPLRILDIGCGTGIELEYIWAQAPNAHITCVDLSCGMLNLLMNAYPDNHDRITIVEASYIDWVYPESRYDIVVSNMTMHHLFPDEKTTVYRKIHSTIIPGGCYIEGDFTMDAIAVEQYRRRFEIIKANLPDVSNKKTVPTLVSVKGGCDGFRGAWLLSQYMLIQFGVLLMVFSVFSTLEWYNQEK